MHKKRCCYRCANEAREIALIAIPTKTNATNSGISHVMTAASAEYLCSVRRATVSRNAQYIRRMVLITESTTVIGVMLMGMAASPPKYVMKFEIIESGAAYIAMRCDCCAYEPLPPSNLANKYIMPEITSQPIMLPIIIATASRIQNNCPRRDSMYMSGRYEPMWPDAIMKIAATSPEIARWPDDMRSVCLDLD